MKKDNIKIAGIVLLAITGYYALQYASAAVHYNCHIIKDDCVPPINATAELIYRTLVQPPWLDQFEVSPTTFFFKDGQFTFWEGNVDGKTVVIRIQDTDSPVMEWIGKGLPLGIPISPASGEHINQWLSEHPDYGLSN